MWNRSRRPGRSGHETFSELIRNQLYRTRSGELRDDDLVQIYLAPDRGDDHEQGAPPASAAAIESLIATTTTTEMAQKDCAVCREIMVSGDEIKQLPCQHCFHTCCIVPWLQRRNTCPICRHELPTDDEDYDLRRQEIRRIEFSPERRSPSTISEEVHVNVEDDDDDDERESQFTDHDGTDFSLEGLLFNDDDYDNNLGEDDEFDRSEFFSEWDTVSDVLFRELMQTHDDDFGSDHGNNGGNHDNDDSYSFGSARRSQFVDAVNLRLQERLNRYVAPFRSEIGRLQHQLNNALQSLRFERARNEQLQRQLCRLEGRFSRSDSETLTVEQLQRMERQLRQGLRQTRLLLQRQVEPAPRKCVQCGSGDIDIVLRPCNCACCCQSCAASGLTRCPSCYQLIDSFRLCDMTR